MMITLPSDQLRWLEAEVAAGRLASVEEGVRLAVAELMAGGVPAAGAPSDDDWVAPLLDEARREFERGESVTLEDFKAHAARRRTAHR